MTGFGESFGTDDEHVRFITVQFKKVGVHPGFDVSEAVG